MSADNKQNNDNENNKFSGGFNPNVNYGSKIVN